jgi:iron complex outermembrane receptor protein
MHKMSIFRTSTLALAAWASGNVSAALQGEDLFFDDFPLVASVSRLPQKLSETPAAVTVIYQEMIRASGARTVEDLLRLVPGFQVSSHNQDPAIVTYHGLNLGMNSEEYGPRLQVLIDGRSQYSPLFKAGVNWNLLPVVLENIERIEVTRGSNTVSYGSNAFMGVINIITLDASQTQGWMLSANHGNNAIRDETLRWGGKAGAADVRLTIHELGDDGFQKGFYSGAWTSAVDHRRSRLIDLRADLAPSNRDEVQLNMSQAEDVSQYGRPGSPTNDPIRNLKQSSTALGLQWRRIVGVDEEAKLRYAYTEDWASGPYLERVSFDTNRTSPTSVTYFSPFDPGGKSAVHELEFTHTLAPLENVRAMWGAGAKSVALRSPAQFSTTDWKHRATYRAFGNLEFREGPQWLFNLGASLEHDSLNGLMLDPRASVSYHLTPEQTLRLVASRAHRTPSLYEAQGRVEKRDVNGSRLMSLTYLAQGVDPERIDTIELGYLGEFKAARASVDLRAFVERLPNRIQILPLALPANSPDDQDSVFNRYYINLNSPYPYGRADGAINLEKAVISGYESQWRWQPFEGTRLIFSDALVSIKANLTDETLVTDTTGDNTDKISRQTRESAPRHAQSAILIQHLPYEVLASLMVFRNGPMRWRRNGDAILASTRIDWRLAKSFKLGPNTGEIAYAMQMANGAQEGRLSARVTEKLHWLSLRLNF